MTWSAIALQTLTHSEKDNENYIDMNVLYYSPIAVSPINH